MDDKIKNIKIETSNAPAAIGPYSQAIQSGNFVYVSGQLPLNPETAEMAPGAIKEQTTQVLKNMKAVLEEAGCGFQNVVKTEVFLKDMADFAEMNEVYAEFFTHDPKPARQAIEAARLPKDALVEISCIAILWDFL